MVGSGDITLLSCITVVMSLLEEEGDGLGIVGCCYYLDVREGEEGRERGDFIALALLEGRRVDRVTSLSEGESKGKGG